VTAALDPTLDRELLCYCTTLTFGELRAACAAGRWPPAGKEQTGKLCTGCQGDLQHCLRLLGVRPPA
jgi:hypothetical protein